MRTVSALVVVCLFAGVVRAQQAPAPPPPQQPYPAPQPQPYPAPQPQPYPYPQQGYGPQYGYGQQPVMPYQLTLDEQYLLEQGYITDGQWLGGGLANLLFGFGIGQAIQGRWSDKGWIFTVGQGASFVAMMYGIMSSFDDCTGYELETDSCDDSFDRGLGIFMAGMVGFTVFYVWGAIDSFAAPPVHNRKLRALQMRLGMPVPMYTRVLPYAAPTRDGDGAVGGLSIHF